jgi:prevent-host-death family protein
MARTVNVYEAKTKLSSLLAEVETGGEIVIARAGRPIARLVKIGAVAGRRQPGAWRGRIHIHDDFDELPRDVARAFTGEDA